MPRLRSFAGSLALLCACRQAAPAPQLHAPRAKPTVPTTRGVEEGVPKPSSPDAGTLTQVAPEQPVPREPEQQARGLTELAVDGFLPALVSWPDVRRWPQPVLVAAHGAGDSAESQCEIWRQLLGRRGVIVCLRGRAIRKGSPERGYYFPDHLTLERELLATLESLNEHHPDQADAEHLVYAGYSQGAQMGLLMLLGRGALAPRLLLVEGGSGDWNERRAAQFKKSGGERVAIVCGTPGCHANAQRSAAVLQKAGVQASARHVPGGGHAYWGAVASECGRAFAELTLGDPRWEG